MESHQKNAGGNARIAETMFRYFRFPKDFASFVWLEPDPAGHRDQDRGRILALAEAALHGHALLAAQRYLAGRELVELDYGGGWKLLPLPAQRFFQPVTVAAIPEAGGFRPRR